MKSPSGGGRILIVDDDRDILDNICDILNEVGYQTQTASDAPTALGLVRRLRCGFDLALLDFRMPGMDGTALLKEMHACCPGLRAIMITGHAGDEGVERARQAGVLKVLQKPLDIASLLETIRSEV